VSDPLDVAIIGGGPAGAAAARFLASWGYRVIVIQRSSAPSSSLAESLPPSTRKLFAALAMTRTIDRAGFYRSTGNTSRWAGETRVEPFGGVGEAGWQVRRAPFDRTLLDGAVAAGARLLDRTSIRRVTPGSDRVRIDGRDSRGRVTIQARFVLDCSGRAGVVARRGFRSHEDGFDTVALVATWQCDDAWSSVLDDASHTLVESGRDQWGWSVPVSPMERDIAVMLDPRLTKVAGARLPTAYRRALSTLGMLNGMTRNARTIGPVRAHHASLYTASRFADGTILLVGDAGSFIDPLSSFGVKKALAAAWRAAVVVNTCLRRPDRRSIALAYFSDREADAYSSCLGQTGRYFREAFAGHGSPFWADRVAAADLAGRVRDAGITPHDLTRHPGIRAAFDSLKASPTIALRAGPGVRVERRPEIVGREVVLEDVLVSDAMTAGARYFRSVNLPGLAALAPEHRHVPDLFAAYNRRYPTASLPDFLVALSGLIANGFLARRSST
jgi:flavin-dependent dehydrogenase